MKIRKWKAKDVNKFITTSITILTLFVYVLLTSLLVTFSDINNTEKLISTVIFGVGGAMLKIGIDNLIEKFGINNLYED